MPIFQTVRDGFDITARLEHDHGHGCPWDENDGHGEVTGWTRRAKRPGELILAEDRGSRRFYDFAGAVATARRDGWNAAPYRPHETAGERAAKAARADFEYLRRWANDDWSYVGVVLSVSRNGITLDDNAASLWGIESDAADYLAEVAEELTAEALARGQELTEALCAC